jgi:hypothetical protein
MKPVTKNVVALVFGVCFGVFGPRYITGILREGFNWQAAIILAGTFVVFAVVQHVQDRTSSRRKRAVWLSLAAVFLVVLANMEP